MAVIRARSLDCPGFLILSLLLLGAGRVLCEGNPESGGAPTVSQCRPHIEAALKDFVTHHRDEQSTLQDTPTEEALHAGEQSEVDTNPTEADEITEKGDTAGEDTAKLTEHDDEETQVEGDDDDDEGTEGDDEEGTGEEGDDTEAEGTAGDKSKEDDEETVAEDENQTDGDEDDDQTADEQDEKTDGDEATGEGDDQDTAGGDEETAGGDEETAAGDEGTEEDDEKTAENEGETAAEGDEETVGAEDEDETEGGEEGDETEGDEGDEETKAGEGDEETDAGEGDETEGGDDDEATAAGKDEGTEGDDDEPTVAETGGEDEDDDDDEKTEAGDEGEETEAGGGEGETDEVGGDGEDDETKAEGGDENEESEEGEEGEATEGDETAQEAAGTEDETKEGEEAGDAGTAEDVSEADETQGGAADEPSGEDGQQSGDDAEDKDHGTEEDVSEPAASEGDECGGEGQSEADEPEEEEETATEEKAEARVKVSRGDLRSRSHIEEILGLDDASISSAISTEKLIQNILKDLKRMYESAIKPMELLYKFKDISNRYVGDSEIFSKPMILFIGPWSSGKSTIINYLLDIEDTKNALPTGAEPKSSDFTVLTHGDSEVMLGGTELAADWTFSTMQKFGQAFLDQLKGMKLPNNLLRKISIVDTPGILENRKIQERTYPFNDVCQWFIDRADIIYVVFDPTKLDMGLEMEALFDQLKGREAQVRIVLNKADTVSPQELMRVQSTLLWNLSPLLGSSEAPTIFVGNFWSRPYVKGSPSTLFEAQEEALLHDLRHVIVGRVENKISFTRRHAVRVRNHAKMVDCYLNTYYNHKTFFGNKKKVADDIIENPQSYHIYEGLSTLTNVSRYDLPDPDIYRDFFRVNPLYEFKQLASTCSFFKGCPLDKLDLTISYELPELMGKYRKLVGATPHGAGGDRR